jgi:hypothetical protein
MKTKPITNHPRLPTLLKLAMLDCRLNLDTLDELLTNHQFIEAKLELAQIEEEITNNLALIKDFITHYYH